MNELRADLERLVDATQGVWELRLQAEQDLQDAKALLGVLQRSYAHVVGENERLRAAITDILGVDDVKTNSGIRLIAEMALRRKPSA